MTHRTVSSFAFGLFLLAAIIQPLSAAENGDYSDEKAEAMLAELDRAIVKCEKVIADAKDVQIRVQAENANAVAKNAAWQRMALVIISATNKKNQFMASRKRLADAIVMVKAHRAAAKGANPELPEKAEQSPASQVNSSKAAQLSEEEITALLQAGIPAQELVSEIEKKGYSGGKDPASLKRLKEAGADAGLLLVITRKAQPPQKTEGDFVSIDVLIDAAGYEAKSLGITRQDFIDEFRDMYVLHNLLPNGFTTLKEKARNGEADAQRYLAGMYERGTEQTGKPDEAQALFWHKKAAAQGDPVSMYLLGQRMITGKGIERDPTQGLSLIRKSAEKDYTPAQTALGKYYGPDGGGLLPTDEKQMLLWLNKAAVMRDAEALLTLGELQEAGKILGKDEAKAASLYREAAILGNLEAQAKLARMTLEGRGMKQDFEKALNLFTNLSLQGPGWAKNLLGQMHEKGTGTKPDMVKAAFLYMEGAAQGAEAGDLKRIIEDEAAMHLIKDAGEKGNPEAQCFLGFWHDHDKQEPVVAAAWFQKAAEQGNLFAQIKLGHMYETGRGLQADPGKALEWYQKAADQGDHTGIKNFRRLSWELTEVKP